MCYTLLMPSPNDSRAGAARPTLVIRGGHTLQGTVHIQGSKNAAQKLIPATLVYPGVYTLTNIPEIGDSDALLDVLVFLGATVRRSGTTVWIDTCNLRPAALPPEITAKSTGTFLFAGALLSRFGHAYIHHPGGDAIGKRPITWHLDAFRALGAEVVSTETYYEVHANHLTATVIEFPRATVNGTVNAILAACRARGTTVLRNVPLEPDIDAVITFLNAAGADITQTFAEIRVAGSSHARGHATIAVHPDRNDSATFMLAGALCGHSVTLSPVVPQHVASMLDALTNAGVSCRLRHFEGQQQVTVTTATMTRPLNIASALFPGFSTDWGPLIQVLMTQLPGVSTFHETIFGARFAHIPELVRMGATIEPWRPNPPVSGYNYSPRDEPVAKPGIRIFGPCRLHGATVLATDVRAGAALVLAALVADGETVLQHYDHVERGYSRFVERLRGVGADIHYLRDHG